MTDTPTALRELLSALFPERCPLCATCVEEPGPCARHHFDVADGVARCGRCADRLGRGLPDGYRCGACALRPPGFQRARVLGDYGPGRPLRDWVLALKHRGRADLAGPLGVALAGALAEREGPAERLLVPVPLHPLRRLERGYDQAALLARAAAEAGGWSVAQALGRRRWTEPQGRAGAGSRRANVAGAFRVAGRTSLTGREVWLVDDVLTSGATASECARLLRRAGAGSVGVLALARALSI